MPRRMKRICTYPGCNATTTTGRCDAHRRDPDRRPSARARGYDTKWARLRNAFIRSHPVCQIRHYCDGDPAVEVDHIVPIRAGGARLDESNLQSACKPCHAWKTKHEDTKYY